MNCFVNGFCSEIPEKENPFFLEGRINDYQDNCIIDPVTGKKKSTCENVGKIKDGIFTFGPSYLAKKQIKELREEIAKARGDS